ncbi:MAG: DNA polymerase III subunit delta' [Candidatus Atribacteria bacterium]|nr:DNA polymerase III subunit delta' [Candidatus Atribacteria bacterium]
MSWSDVYGHEWQKDFFRRILRSRRIAHAYLFFGPSQIGKETFAREVAKTLLCLTPRGEESCEQCRSCALFHARSHPDLVMLSSPDSIKIDQVREFVKTLSLKKVLSPFKVGVLTDVEKLTEEASNCLLKTIEEPPAESVLFLTTSMLHALLPTIISRVQLVEFSSLSEEEVQNFLVERKNMPEREARRIASLAAGSIGRALEILEGKEDLFQEVLRFWKSFKGGASIVSLGQWFGAMDVRKMIRFFTLLEWYLRDVLVAVSSGGRNEELFFQKEWMKEVLDDAQNLGVSLVMGIIRSLEELVEDLASHVQPDIAIIDFLGKVRGEMSNAMGSRSTV